MQTERPYMAFEFLHQEDIRRANAHIKECLEKGEKPSLIPLSDEEYQKVKDMDEVARSVFIQVRLKEMIEQGTWNREQQDSIAERVEEMRQKELEAMLLQDKE